jgi:hypothetical protein
MFVGAAGSPYAAFRCAIEARNLTRALTEARDLPQISLVDAAELVVLAAEQHGPSFDRWAGSLGRSAFAFSRPPGVVSRPESPIHGGPHDHHQPAS